MSWETVQLKDVAIVSAGNSAPQDDAFFEGGVHNFYRTSDVGRIRKGVISNSVDKLNVHGIKGLKLFSVGTILFPKSGASTFLNHRVILGNEGYVSSHLATIKAKSEFLEDKYLFYFLTTIDAKDLIQDSSYPSLRTSVIETVELQLPPLPTQQKIVAKLDAIFAEIDKAQAAAEANAKNTEAFLSQVLNSLDRGYDGDLKELGDCVNLLSGFAFKSNEYSNNEMDIPLLRGDNLKPKNIDLSEVKRFDRSRFNEYAKYSLEPNDIVLGMDRPIISTGLRIAKVQNKDIPSLLVQRVMRLRCNNGVDSDFLFYLLNSTNFINHLVGEQTGLGVPHISGKTISNFQIKIPTIGFQQQIVSKLSSISKCLNSYSLANRKIISNWTLYKQAILQQAFSGELVKD